MPKFPYTPLYVSESKTDKNDGVELRKFLDALRAVYNADIMAVHHTQGTIDIYPKAKVDIESTYFTIHVAPADKMNEEIKKLNASRELFDQFIKSKAKETEVPYKTIRSQL